MLYINGKRNFRWTEALLRRYAQISSGAVEMPMSRRRVPKKERDTARRWLRFAIHASGLSANQLARKAGLSQTTITRFISGRTEFAPTRETLEKIAAAAGVDPPKLGDWEASAYSLLTENTDCRNLISEAVRLADRLAHDEALNNNPAALRKYREAFLPGYTLMILDALADLQKGGTLDASAITAIEATLRRVALNRQKQFWQGNALSPFRDQSEPQSSAEPRSETADQPSDDQPDEPSTKTAA